MMNEREYLTVLITCSGLSNAGKCTTQAALMLRQRNPDLDDYHIVASGTESMTVLEGIERESLKVFVIDGCEDFCGRKKAERCGFITDFHVVATACGVIKFGMDKQIFRDIEAVCRATEKEMRQ